MLGFLSLSLPLPWRGGVEQILWGVKRKVKHLLIGAWMLLSRVLVRNPIMILAPAPPESDHTGTVTVVLYPLCVDIVAFYTDPTHGGPAGLTPGAPYFEVALQGYTSGIRPVIFITVYGLQATIFPDGVPMRREGGGSDIFSGDTAYIDTAVFGSPTMPGMWAAYYIPAPTDGSGVFVWPSPAPSTKPVTFVDVNGNRAYFGPVIVAQTASIDAGPVLDYEIHYPTITVTFLTSDGFSAQLLVERSHLPFVDSYLLLYGPPNGGVVFTWLEEAVLGVANPLDPTNTDQVVVTVTTEGAHTFGVQAQYKNFYTGALYDCFSWISQVVEVSFD